MPSKQKVNANHELFPQITWYKSSLPGKKPRINSKMKVSTLKSHTTTEVEVPSHTG